MTGQPRRAAHPHFGASVVCRLVFRLVLGLPGLAVAAGNPHAPEIEKLALPADGMFDRMRADIRPEFASALREAAVSIKARLGDGGSVLVVGHTDGRLSRQHNQALSEARARNVAAFLEREGIAWESLQVLGKGAREPIASNNSAEGRQRNRRVEIYITRPAMPAEAKTAASSDKPSNMAPSPAGVVRPERATSAPIQFRAWGHAQDTSPAIVVMRCLLYSIVFLIGVYTLRHYLFTLNRLFGRQRHPYTDIDTANWPTVTILIAAHNEEAVIAGALEAVLDVDYPADRLRIMPVNDRSSDRTEEIIDAICTQHPGRIMPFHRRGGKPGKAAALKDAMGLVNSELIIVFDADYIPSRGLIKQLAAPFFDPEVGAVMGRVVPLNVGSSLLTRLLDLERAGGYQVDQQARMNLDLVPQYGGTVGGVRVVALQDVGGWHDDVLAEDTDLTYRLLLRGWKTVYQNRSECYEEVPETWEARIKQIKRWAKGHNQALFRHAIPLLGRPGVKLRARIDGLLLLGTYAMAPLLVLGWALSIALYFLDKNPTLDVIFALFALMSFSALGNFAAFFEIAAAVHLDGNRQRTRLLPFNYLGFLVSLVSITRATFDQLVLDPLLRRGFHWDKTVRYRQVSPS